MAEALSAPLALPGLGDRGFFRVNSRLEPEQLEAGYLQRSLNGRMDRGSWQPRRAIRNLSGALEVTGDPLRIPFFLVDTVGGLTITSAERIDDLVFIVITGHPFPVDEISYMGVESLTGTVDPNGVRLITILDANNLLFTIPGATGSETYAGTGKVRSVLDDAAAAQIFASCLFSDPSDDSAESIIEAATGVAFRVEVSDGTVSEIAYPTGGTLSGEIDMIQAADKVILFRSGSQAWEWHPRGRAVVSGARASNVVTLTLKNHGLTAGDSVVVAGITGFGADDPNGTFTVTGIPTTDTFTYADTGGDDSFDANTGTVTAGFTKVRAGTYTQPQVFEVTGGDVDVVSGLCTLSGLTNTTVATGDTVRVFDTDNTDFLPFIGRTFVVTAASSTAISFYIPVGDRATIGTDILSVGKQVSVGAGFRHMPAPPWGVYFQNRLVTPYRYTQTGDTASPTYTDRDVRDELVISDILDTDTYDAISNQFRITGGAADFLVGVQPFANDFLIVLMRNSIHLISGVSGALDDTNRTELTREIGLLARKSVVQHGENILFLSDNGVYAISFLDQYNLRGVDLPLSDAIQPEIDRINANLASEAVGIYFNNRYYLAAPLDSALGANDATGNNAILTYNFLNEGWESVDSVDDERWSVLNFHIARAGARNDLYAVNANGGVHKLDAADSDSDELALSAGADLEFVPVSSALTTRSYDLGMPERKRFSEIQLQAESAGQSSDFTIEFETENPDSTVVVGSYSTLKGESLAANEGASLRARTGGQRGHNAAVTLTPTEGRPKFKNLSVKAKPTNAAATTQT